LDVSRPTVALTFDDGYADNAGAAAILEASGVRGTFYVTSGFIAGNALWFDRASEYLRRLRAGVAGMPREGTPAAEAAGHVATLDGWLGWLKSLTRERREEVLEALGASAVPSGCEPMGVAQLAAMARAGHEIAGHTATHPVLTCEPVESVREELEASKRQIESWIGGPVTGFCYPNGSWSEGVRQACVDAGYAYATTTRRHINAAGQDVMTLGRRWISPDNSTGLRGGHSGAVFAAEVLGLHDVFRARIRRPRGAKGSPPAPPSHPLPKAA
jgi:peptidoglycan/xylan/chitin deacetylase (PgdA/CDA1 family)